MVRHFMPQPLRAEVVVVVVVPGVAEVLAERAELVAQAERAERAETEVVEGAAPLGHPVAAGPPGRSSSAAQFSVP